jgi:hypothetical protein
MNKKLIVIGLSVLMTLTVLSGISGLANATTDGGFNIYTIGTDYANFTLPNYKVWQFGYNNYGRNMTNQPILAEINGNYGFIYQDSSNTLAFYNIKTDTYSVLTSSWQNYTIPNSYDGRNIGFWAARQNLFYTQLLNGNISEISSFGLINGYFYVQQYNAVNNTYISRNTTLPYTDVQVSTWSSGNYQYNIFPFTISNGTYEFTFTESSASYNDNVTSGIYIWNIYSGKFFASNIGGLGVSETSANNKDVFYTISTDMANSGGIVQLDVFDWATDTFNYEQKSFDASNTNNNMPFFIEDNFNGTFTIEFYQNTANGGSTFGGYYFYFNNNTKQMSNVITVSVSDNINDVETMSNQEVYIFKNLVSGVNGDTYFLGGYTDIAGAYFNYYNNSLMQSNLTWLNIENNKTGDPATNVLIAETNNSLFYTFDAGTSQEMTSTTTLTVYWSPQFSKGIISYQPTVSKYNLEIKENGLPSGTSWSYTFNGTSYSLTNNSYNYSLVNGNYALSVSSVNGYTVTYPSTITIDNASKIAYVNFTAIPKYSVTIQENGLPSNTQWNFTIKHSGTTVIAETLTTSSYTTSLQNDTYDLYAGSISGFNMHIHTSPFTVSGSAITEYINYTAIPTYTLFLKETGLASGTTWIAYIGSTEYTSSNAYINVTGLTNGTYSLSIDNVVDYSLSSYPTSFTITGSNYYINVTFTHNTTLYQVKFIANHIANVNAITWTIVFNGTQYASKNSNTIIVPSLKNGSYSLVVNSVSGYITDKYPSTISISGSNITQELYFNETFSFQVNETGYSGQWFIIFNGTSYSSSTSTLIISGLVNYSYPLSVTTPTGYSVSSYPNIIKINGNNEYLNIIFTKTIITKGYFIVEFVIAGYRGNISIIINNVIYYTTNGYKNVTLPNGSYNPVIELPSGYELAQPLPTLNVNGNNTVYPIYVKSYIDWQKYEPVIVIGLLLLTVLIIPAVVRAGRR